ncbi:hypothetical protein UPTC5079_001275 [Campylobacter lari]|uniref:hypothetical protein n=1 Tax=Campylobacter lari TaxID=201 RepID=UPI00215208D7|nr:hypothetical protein [Campylobacter lari]MCR6558961.1 hypothetical protein [Campylobacter lari]MCV3429705.1 hypothetical protein [Campylobacter lari]
MKWEKKGLIFCPDNENSWIHNTTLTPQPFIVREGEIRIYTSFRDKNGIGRIGYIDIDERNPKKILRISSKPVIDIGKDGAFDDNGMILGDILKVKNQIYMYYVAFQKVEKVKFLAFSGLAISDNNGEFFSRIQETPILDRTTEGLYGRCIHSVLYENGIFKIWYSVIHGWQVINNIPYPSYYIKYSESKNGIIFQDKGVTSIQCNKDEYRIGRPKVYKTDFGYEMYYTSDTYTKEYKSGYAVSFDGINWTRKDDCFSLKKSKQGFDSEMICYPSIIKTKYKTYMFYCGNGMGRDGFGYAELSSE